MARTFKTKVKPGEQTEIRDVYQRVTDKIIADLEAGERTWHQPWRTGNSGGGVSMPLRHDGTPYRGVNVLMLWGEAMLKGYRRSIWMTYRQAAALGGQVRGGEKGALVVYADKMIKTETDASGAEDTKVIPFLKGYSVFNVEQIDGLPLHYYAIDDAPAPEAVRIDNAMEFVKNTGAVVREGGDKAFYAPHLDYIQIPPAAAFNTPAAHASILLHELVHWTGHTSRCNREFGKRFGDQSYAAEELVAELGNAFLCADLGIAAEERPDHSAYVQSWLKVLKKDKRFIFTAASAAQRAADYLHEKQGRAVVEDDEKMAAD